MDHLLRESHRRELETAQARQRLVTAFISVRTLSDFVVLRKLGSGSNGMVLMCRVDNDAIEGVAPGLVVAVKLLFNFGVDGAQLDQMSAAEYKCLAALPSHPNVVALLATVGPAQLTPAMTRHLPPVIREISEEHGQTESVGIVLEYVRGVRFCQQPHSEGQRPRIEDLKWIPCCCFFSFFIKLPTFAVWRGAARAR
jgi:hypothetical protein